MKASGKTIIFFKGVYDTLDLFTDNLIQAFADMGYHTFVYDARLEGLSKEQLLAMLRDRAGDRSVSNPGSSFTREQQSESSCVVVTFNNLGYNLDLPDGRNIWEVYQIPYVDILMDHPFHYGKPLSNMPETAGILCTDRNHVTYIQRFFPNIKRTGFLPHAGVEFGRGFGEKAGGQIGETGEQPCGRTAGKIVYRKMEDRSIPVLYAGALPIYTVAKMIPDLSSIPEVDGEDMAQSVLSVLVQHPDRTTESAIEEYVRSVRSDVPDWRLHEIIVKMRFLDSYATSFFREQAVRLLVESGISVLAYGTGWDQCEWSQNSNLTYGGKVLAPQILPLMNDARIVLNTMTWFKAGAHDRIFNGMLAGAGVVTDSSTYLKDVFADGEELSMFELSEIDSLPERVHELLTHPKRLQELADCGYEAARLGHTWKNRAQEIVRFIYRCHR